ncbi:helix-turn-helix domain-containing protein [Weissella kandleri]|nr:helix-turn-helix transcriptional regulator [Weissella kandleri]
MTIFERVKLIAKKRGLSLVSINDTANLGKNAIYKWKTQTPNSEALSAVAKVLNVSVDYLLGNTDEMIPNKKGPSTEPEEIDLDAALEDKGVVMRFQGKELSDKAKRGILDIIKLVDGDED